MKKVLIWMLIACCLFSLAGCQTAEQDRTSGEGTESAESEITETEETETDPEPLEEDEESDKVKAAIMEAAAEVEDAVYEVSDLIAKESDENGTYYTFLADCYRKEYSSQVEITVYAASDGSYELISEIARP